MVCHPQARRYRDVESLLIASSKQQRSVVCFINIHMGCNGTVLKLKMVLGWHSVKTKECTLIKNPKYINGCHVYLTYYMH